MFHFQHFLSQVSRRSVLRKVLTEKQTNRQTDKQRHSITSLAEVIIKRLLIHHDLIDNDNDDDDDPSDWLQWLVHLWHCVLYGLEYYLYNCVKHCLAVCCFSVPGRTLFAVQLLSDMSGSILHRRINDHVPTGRMQTMPTAEKQVISHQDNCVTIDLCGELTSPASNSSRYHFDTDSSVLCSDSSNSLNLYHVILMPGHSLI